MTFENKLKNMLRRAMKRRKARVTDEWRQNESERICHEISVSQQWEEARTVMLYCALPDEVDLRPLMNGEKRVVLPVVVGDDLEIRVYEGEGSLQQGAFGIMEPTGPRLEDESEVDLVLVPGVAFDAAGGRLGRGLGYYDRLLPRLTGAKRMGVCFSYQMLEWIPTLDFDQRMDGVFR